MHLILGDNIRINIAELLYTSSTTEDPKPGNTGAMILSPCPRQISVNDLRGYAYTSLDPTI
jgi:hypothetical protein